MPSQAWLDAIVARRISEKIKTRHDGVLQNAARSVIFKALRKPREAIGEMSDSIRQTNDLLIRAQLDDAEKQLSLVRSRYVRKKNECEELKELFVPLGEARTILRKFAAIAPNFRNSDPRAAVVQVPAPDGTTKCIEARDLLAAAEWVERWEKLK